MEVALKNFLQSMTWQGSVHSGPNLVIGHILTFRLSSGMDRKVLRDDQWERIEQLLPVKATDRGVTAKDSRRFVEAVLRQVLIYLSNSLTVSDSSL